MTEELYGGQVRGSITLFLAMILSFLPVLLFTILEGARLNTLETLVREAGELSIDSLFAGYDKELFDRYGLLFLNGGKGQGLINFEQIESDFRDYFEANTGRSALSSGFSLLPVEAENASVDEVITATDYSGAVFIRNVLDFYRFDAVNDVLTELQEEMNVIDSLGEPAVIGWNSADGKYSLGRIDNSHRRSWISPLLEAAEEGEAAEDYDHERYDETIENSVIGQAEKVRKGSAMAFVLPKDRALSSYHFKTSNFPSVVSRDKRTLPEDKVFMKDAASKVMLGEYILDYFPNFVSSAGKPGADSGPYDEILGSEEENVPAYTAGVSPYAVEYILFGKDSDAENLKKTVNRLLWIREGLNMTSILASERRRAEAEAAATVLVGWTGIEPLVFTAAAAIEAAWAFAESLCDVKILLSGGRVPLIKQETGWNLSLSNVSEFFKGGFDTAGSHDSGLSYDGHLRLLLYTMNIEDEAYRTMDMIQMNMQVKDPSYLFSSEIAALEMKTDLYAKEVFTALPLVRKKIFAGWTGYRLEERFSGAY